MSVFVKYIKSIAIVGVLAGGVSACDSYQSDDVAASDNDQVIQVACGDERLIGGNR